MKYNIDDLKKEYIGKQFNWLTILDVYRNEKSLIMCKCQCRCGKLVNTELRYIINYRNKSCGCYNSSSEKSEILKSWWSNNPDKVKNIVHHRMQTIDNNPQIQKQISIKYSEWCKNNPDKVKAKNQKYLDWCLNNKDKCISRAEKCAKWYRENPECVVEQQKTRTATLANKRKQVNYSEIIDLIHPDYIHKLNLGLIKSKDNILIKCPICDKYNEHMLGNIILFTDNSLKRCRIPMCSKCRSKLQTSYTEQEIEEYISTFYIGKCTRNNRDIIKPLELDLYYPYKKIAIEFNGNYWHNEDHKDKLYHYNKFRLCKDKGILLVSIFESEWNSNKDNIKEYLKDLFNGKENKLSFNDNKTLINNNYPCISKYKFDSHIIEDYYIYQDKKIYTCGYSKIM